MQMRNEVDLDPILNAKSVAIIGASRNPGKVGHVIIQNYLNAGYEGRLYLVNKNAEEILGMRTYKSILDIRDRIDCAVIAIPAEAVPEALEECGRAHVKGTVVVSGGFAEVGNDELERRVLDISRRYKMPMIGPNCLGVMDPRSRTDTLFLPTFKLSRPQVGGVAFVAQSGAVGSTILDLVSSEGFGLSKFISYGNATDVDEVDILNYLMNDKETTVIVMYIEGTKRGREFVEMARKITKVKPVIVLKAGRTEAGIAAAHSHTAALAGDYEAHEALFRQFGFTIANDISELLYYAKIFASEPTPSGGRVAIVTNGGGTGVLTADAVASSRYLKLASLSKETERALRRAMPLIVNIRNPLDLAGDAGDKRYHDALALLASDRSIDMLIVIALFQTPGADSALASELIRIKENIGKPMIVISIGAAYTQMHKIMMESAGLPVYDSPAAAAAACIKRRPQ